MSSWRKTSLTEVSRHNDYFCTFYPTCKVLYIQTPTTEETNKN